MMDESADDAVYAKLGVSTSIDTTNKFTTDESAMLHGYNRYGQKYINTSHGIRYLDCGKEY